MCQHEHQASWPASVSPCYACTEKKESALHRTASEHCQVLCMWSLGRKCDPDYKLYWLTWLALLWQVPEAYITRLELIPNIDEETISVLVHGSKAAKDAPFRAEVTASGSSITAAKGKVGKQLVISIPKPKLWSPESPFLYDLEITLEADSPHAVVSLLYRKLLTAGLCWHSDVDYSCDTALSLPTSSWWGDIQPGA